MIAALLSSSRHVRRHAFDRLAVDRETAFAARDALVSDRDASVRARAAFFLARAPVDIARPTLHDALLDALPLVRHAAIRALAVCGDDASFALASRIAIEDPIWWVRRAAIVTSANLGGRASIAMLREALEDPFWRVRSASVRALITFGEDVLDDLAPADTARAAGAMSYLARRLGVFARAPHVPLDAPNAIVAQLDPDPAIVTARIERGDAVTPAFLVACLGDPHEALRATAKKRLARTHDHRALEIALLWLDEPRIPHAATTVIDLLDGLDRDDVDHVLDVAFERARDGAFGAACWAASYVGLTRDASRHDAVRKLASADHAIVRCAAIAALGALGGDDAFDTIAPALADDDPRVVRTAVETLPTLGDVRADAALATFSRTSEVHVRRVLALSAAERNDRDALRAFSRDTDARTRAIAITARASMDDLDAASRAACITDEDPWIRIAALDASSVEQALESDPQPSVRRAAFRVLVAMQPRRAAELARRCDDARLRVRATSLLDARDTEHLVALLRLARDASPAVRAAAADALERANVDDALDALLASARLRSDDDVQPTIAALAHRSRRFEARDFDRLRAARTDAGPTVRAWIDDVLGDAPSPAVGRVKRVTASAPRRTLGATGLALAPLVVSGAGMLRVRAYADAMHAGCNYFFWEPRYHALGRMLARERDAAVICGTYEATERSIVSDVERSLRRLRRDVLDVFLLFWARSPARVDAPLFDVLSRLKDRGMIRAFGFSTHDRALACDAINARSWDVVMTRHSAVHPGAEDRLFPLAREKNVGVLAFSALSYGRILSDTITAVDAYSYSLSQPSVAACLSAPRTTRELEENLAALDARALSPARQDALRAHGKIIHAESRDFARSIRRHPIALGEWLDREELQLDAQRSEGVIR
jgi:aryl-alcohol dehydrogenase-like predicted oxidoreductase/HEAT repeat protein